MMCIDGGEFLEAKVSQGTSQSNSLTLRWQAYRNQDLSGRPVGDYIKTFSMCDVEVRTRPAKPDTDVLKHVCVSSVKLPDLNESTFAQGEMLPK